MGKTMEQSTDTLIRAATERDALDTMHVSRIATLPKVDMVIKLLDRAATAIDSDHAAAKYCIAQASALLQVDHAGGESEVCDRTSFARGGLSPWQVRQVTRHIDASLASTIRTDDCAGMVRLSNSHFRRAFKTTFGETFYGYVSRRRVQRAQELMMTTDRALCEIALRCGFADQSHFTRVFRRLVGPSPAIWRRMQ
jgi:transcriptional regulator GlxA family with amidase domain